MGLGQVKEACLDCLDIQEDLRRVSERPETPPPEASHTCSAPIFFRGLLRMTDWVKRVITRLPESAQLTIHCSRYFGGEVHSPHSLIRKVADVLLRLDPRSDDLRHLLDAPYQIHDVRRSTRDVLEMDPRRLEDRRERRFARRFELAKDERNAR
jgi:hypothetical protein